MRKVEPVSQITQPDLSFKFDTSALELQSADSFQIGGCLCVITLEIGWTLISDIDGCLTYSHEPSGVVLALLENSATVDREDTKVVARDVLDDFKRRSTERAVINEAEIVHGEDDISKFDWGHQATISLVYSDSLFLQSFGFVTRLGTIELTCSGSISDINAYDEQVQTVLNGMTFAEEVW